MPRLFELFWVFFKIGAFTLGGGYAMIPLVQDEVCKKKKWSTDGEFLDIVSISQSLPGALVVNTSAILGYKLLGIPGLICAVLGSVLPSFVSILAVAIILIDVIKYTPGTLTGSPANSILQAVFKGVRPAVAALIAFSVVRLGKQLKLSYFNLSVGALALALLILKVNPIFIIIAAAFAGLISSYAGGKRNAKTDN